MAHEIINYPFNAAWDKDDRDPSDRSSEETCVDRTTIGTPDIKYVNGHNLPDDDDDVDEEENDLILGDEDELDEADLAEDEVDVEVDEDVDAVVGDDDLVLETDDDVLDEDDEEDEDDL